MLTVVEHDQNRLVAEMLDHTFRQRAALAFFHLQGEREGAQGGIGIHRRRQINEPGAGPEMRQHVAGNLERQSRLADATTTDDSGQSLLAQECAEQSAFRNTADEGAVQARQIVLTRAHAAQGRELSRQDRMAELE